MGWNSHVHRELPGKLESSNLSREILSREIGRRRGHCLIDLTIYPTCLCALTCLARDAQGNLTARCMFNAVPMLVSMLMRSLCIYQFTSGLKFFSLISHDGIRTTFQNHISLSCVIELLMSLMMQGRPGRLNLYVDCLQSGSAIQAVQKTCSSLHARCFAMCINQIEIGRCQDHV